jgi:NitT/TauT family transport system substrate-binding protein
VKRFLVAASAAALMSAAVVACGDDSGKSSSNTTAASAGATAASATTAAVGHTAGCEKGSTDPADRSATRKPARCAAGSPAPKPLAQRAKIRISSAFKAEFLAPLYLAQAMGEFNKENLDVEIVSLPFPDAVPQLATGQLDAAIGGTDATFFNAVNTGIDIKWAQGNFFPPSAGDKSVPQTGVWVRKDIFSNPDKPNVAELKGKTIASAVGITNSTSYFIDKMMQEGGLHVTDLKFTVIPSADMLQALDNKAVDAAYLLDPYWLKASESGKYVLMATQTPGEPIGGYYYSPKMVKEDREKAKAFTRAMIRTISTYLDGDYQSHPDVMNQLATASGQTLAALNATPSLVFDWEIRQGTGEAIQKVLMTTGPNTLRYTTVLPEERYVDRSIYEDVINGK